MGFFNLFLPSISSLCHSSFLHCLLYVCCVEAGCVWWSLHPVDSIIDSLLLTLVLQCVSSLYFFTLLLSSFYISCSTICFFILFLPSISTICHSSFLHSYSH